MTGECDNYITES